MRLERTVKAVLLVAGHQVTVTEDVVAVDGVPVARTTDALASGYRVDLVAEVAEAILARYGGSVVSMTKRRVQVPDDAVF